MKVEQIYTGCLAQGAYYITSNGEAVIIDPLREVQPYLDRLKKDDVELKYIFETHFHADFASGHIDLAKATGATIVYGPTADTNFECIVANDEEIFTVGDVKIKALHTPGHTLESVTYLLYDESGDEYAIFSGDTLFLGDVGRPDLAQKQGDYTQDDLAGLLYDSLQSKIMPLKDNVLVYPAHGAGSACGKNMMDATVDTLGNQKKMNYALNQPNKAAFIEAVLDGLLPPPAYFASMVKMNKGSFKNTQNEPVSAAKGLPLEAFCTLMKQEDVTILDTRDPALFCQGFIPQSINIGGNKNLAPWAGSILKDINRKLLLIAPEGQESESILRIRRVGFDNVLGFLIGGYSTWLNSGKDIETIQRSTPSDFSNQKKDSQIIDIRKKSEFDTAHIENAINLPLEEIEEWWPTLDPTEHFWMHCRSGYRSMIAASILKAHGFHNFSEIEGGILAIEENGEILCK